MTSTTDCYYMVREPWQWVMNAVATDSMKAVEKLSDLPSEKLLKANMDASNGMNKSAGGGAARGSGVVSLARRRQRKKERERRSQKESTLRIEVFTESGRLQLAAHGISAALDSLEDKDELVRTIQRCRCEHLNLSPPSILLNWDVSREECKRLVGDSLPVLPENHSNSMRYAVLKDPVGKSGMGVFFIKDAEDIDRIISEHRHKVQQDAGLLDKIIDAKGRIPSWVIQAEVSPCLLLGGKYKFHLRSYFLVVEKPGHEELIDVVLYDRHEVLVAPVPVSDDPNNRERVAHITNGSYSKNTRRILLDECPELVERKTKDRVHLFLAQTFGYHLLPDLEKRVEYAATMEEDDNNNNNTNGISTSVRKFSLAAVDLMMTQDNRIYMLEVNVNPSAPPPELVDQRFTKHLKGFLQDLMDFVLGRDCRNFTFAADILEAMGVTTKK